MKMTAEELKAKLEAHRLWRETYSTDNVQGERADLMYANLRDADLMYADLAGANLTYANLTGADLTGADLTNADLTNADLTGADLTGADLTNADLTGAILTGADLTNADLTNADLTDADLCVSGASPYVYDVIAMAQALAVAMKKTRLEWRAARRRPLPNCQKKKGAQI